MVQDFLECLLQKEKGEIQKTRQTDVKEWICLLLLHNWATISHLSQSHSDLDIQYRAELDRDPDVDKVKVVTQCYSTIEASSNVTDIYKMTNGETASFWQSDGSARSHWIRSGCDCTMYSCHPLSH